ncbi:MAG: tetratricopeptide repeat protein [Gemmatimonadetes bacterium]|nr:tetratricopeptide repeat protein [Gemmatimonadota bacterium]
MAEDKVTRKLTTILAADVEGYTRLMRADEEATLKTLDEYRQIIDGLIARHDGRVFSTGGDSVLAEFASAVEAVRCAISCQEEISSRNAELADDRKLKFRIGINVGDVMIREGDLFGDGVNVAARLEGLAEAGGVCISSSVFEQIKYKLSLGFEDMGPQEVKNIAEPISVYRVKLEQRDTAVIPVSEEAEAHWSRSALAVLPFANLSGDPEQEYFSDGLTDDIITALSAWRTFPVIARNSVFTYKGKAVKVQQVAKDLGVRYVLEGSVRKGGNRVRITAQLIDARTGHHLWSEKFDRDLDDIFEVQDEITQLIAAIVDPELSRAEGKRSATKKPKSLDARDCYQRGMSLLYEHTKEGNNQARQMFAQAIKIDPTYATPFVGLAYSHQLDILMEYTESREDSIDELFKAARQAIALDDMDSMAHVMMCFACRWVGKHDLAISEAKEAVELNPSNAVAHIHLGNILDLAGHPNEGISNMEKGLQLNPRDPRYHFLMSVLARAHLNARRYKDAVEWASKSIHRRPDHPRAHAILAISLAHLGQREEARAALDACERVRPGFAERWAFLRQYRNSADNEHILEGLRKAGWKG